MGAKLHMSKGKQPRPPSKVPNFKLSVLKEVGFLRQLGGLLRSSDPLKSA